MLSNDPSPPSVWSSSIICPEAMLYIPSQTMSSHTAALPCSHGMLDIRSSTSHMSGRFCHSVTMTASHAASGRPKLAAHKLQVLRTGESEGPELQHGHAVHACSLTTSGELQSVKSTQLCLKQQSVFCRYSQPRGPCRQAPCAGKHWACDHARTGDSRICMSPCPGRRMHPPCSSAPGPCWIGPPEVSHPPCIKLLMTFIQIWHPCHAMMYIMLLLLYV